MNSSKAGYRVFFKLTRFDYSVLAASTIILSGIYSRDLSGLQFDYVVGFIVALMVVMGTFSINDYYDYRIDKDNRRYDRPLVRDPEKRDFALKTGLLLYTAVLLISLLLNSLASIFILINLLIFFLYNYSLRKRFLLKNIVVSYGFSAAIIFGSIISDYELEPLILYFALMSFIIGLAFEVMIDIGDVDGDRRSKTATIPVRYSKRFAAKISILLYIMIMILDPLPFFVNIDQSLYRDIVFLPLIIIPVVSYFFISKALLKDQSTSSISRLRKRTLNTMQLGCIVYVIGVLL